MSAATVATLRRPLDLIRHAMSRMQSAEVFCGHGTNNVLDEAAALVLGALDLPFDTPDLYLRAVLLPEEIERVLALLEQRVTEKVPVAYLLGRAQYAGLEFIVSPDVLVPRSPLAEFIAGDGQPWLLEEPQRALDLCTGSGCLAILMALQFPESQVDAADISPEALAIADKNRVKHGLQERIELLQGDGLGACEGRQYDLILSNPPYVSEAEYATLPQEYRHEPQLGLTSGEEGLDFCMNLLDQAPDHLNPGGLLVCELGNSAPALARRLPHWPLTWLEFEQGGDGVFVISREELISAKED